MSGTGECRFPFHFFGTRATAFLSVVLSAFFPLSGVEGIGERGALLGPIISVWDRMWSFKNPAAAREGSGKPLPWPFGPHVAVNKQQPTLTLHCGCKGYSLE